MDKLTVIILAKNEEKNIGKCLESVSFCKNILVADDGSTDNTQDIARQYGARVIQHISGGDFANQRNFAMGEAQTDWVLFVDADERVSALLKTSLENFMMQSVNFTAYNIKRRDWWWGKELKHGETKSARNKGIIRLVKKGYGKWTGKVHEVFVPEKPDSSGTLGGFLEHYPHQTLKEFISDINDYSTIRATELYSLRKKTSILQISLFPLGKFIYTYLIKAGFLDGPAGFSYSFLMSFHSFLVRAKLYQYWVKGGADK